MEPLSESGFSICLIDLPKKSASDFLKLYGQIHYMTHSRALGTNNLIINWCFQHLKVHVK